MPHPGTACLLRWLPVRSVLPDRGLLLLGGSAQMWSVRSRYRIQCGPYPPAVVASGKPSRPRLVVEVRVLTPTIPCRWCRNDIDADVTPAPEARDERISLAYLSSTMVYKVRTDNAS